MLHNFCSETAPAHVRDFYMARLYRTPTAAVQQQQQQQHQPAHPVSPVAASAPAPSDAHSATAEPPRSSDSFSTTHPDPSLEYRPAYNDTVRNNSTMKTPDSPRSIPLQQPAEHSFSPLLGTSPSCSLQHQQHLPHDQQQLPMRPRPRGGDGRFVPRADEYSVPNNRYSKICGWCRTTSTSQWRVGPTNGSVEMGTLCNACGINYRRALAKTPDGVLNLDKLSQQMGHTRLSIQKALKRQRKLSANPTAHMKRTRPDSGASSRGTAHLGIVQSILGDHHRSNPAYRERGTTTAVGVGAGATTSSVTIWDEPSPTSANATAGAIVGAIAASTARGSRAKNAIATTTTTTTTTTATTTTTSATSPHSTVSLRAKSDSAKQHPVPPLSLSVGLPMPRAFGTAPPPPPPHMLPHGATSTSAGNSAINNNSSNHSNSSFDRHNLKRSAPKQILGRANASSDGEGEGESGAGNKTGSWRSGTHSITFSPAGSDRSAPSKLPPFQSFLGSLERQNMVI